MTLLISDVPSNDPINMTSGPIVLAPTTYADALEILIATGSSPNQGFWISPPAAVARRSSPGASTSRKPTSER
ncbi:DUF4147 domain-containing protein [Microvirga aerilata]|uniref:DUF4147 domain-containing protein n=1 Tax=Microvirga aerilata TaxID=670292 RepID=A0A937CXX6_9HYPH|nr:DUF4147 domain-containing protein [Microvirga aerilata]